jgi:hypothetical protein
MQLLYTYKVSFIIYLFIYSYNYFEEMHFAP